MNSRTKDLLKSLIEEQLQEAAHKGKSGEQISDGEHIALGLHGLTLQMAEVASALGRIYMALEKGNQLDEQCSR